MHKIVIRTGSLGYWSGGSKTKCNHRRPSSYIILVNAKKFQEKSSNWQTKIQFISNHSSSKITR